MAISHLDVYPKTKKVYVLPEPIPRCSHNHRMPCHWQPCSIDDLRFTRFLDRYCEKFGSRPSTDLSGAPGSRDFMRQTIPDLLSLEVASWFDDREALERYAAWKDNQTLRMDADICREFRWAWCRWFVRMGPLGVHRPAWMRGWGEYQRIAIGRHMSAGGMAGT